MRTPGRKFGALLLGVAVVIGIAACSPQAASTTASATAKATTAAATGTITVYGAASLQPTFTTLATKFEAANPGATVKTMFAGSAVLVTQIQQGAPADVFASADTITMGTLTKANLMQGPAQNFATNILEIAVPKGNPAHITDFADLAKPGVKTVICAPAVPCGAATAKVETSTGVALKPVSEESSVTDVLAKVTSGEADAGLVYVTDVKAAGDNVQGVNFSEASSAVNTYPIAAVKASRNPKLAAAFVAYVTGPVGQGILKTAGFGKP